MAVRKACLIKGKVTMVCPPQKRSPVIYAALWLTLWLMCLIRWCLEDLEAAVSIGQAY